jgi:hypothetical protein
MMTFGLRAAMKQSEKRGGALKARYNTLSKRSAPGQGRLFVLDAQE